MATLFSSLAALLLVLRVSAQDGADPLADCAAGSYYCAANCTSVMFCLSSGEAIEVDVCAEGSACDATAHACVAGGACVTPPDPDVFPCHDFGYFPNPYECTRFHLCLNNASQQAETTTDCPEGTAYDALSTRCSLGLDSRPCVEAPVPKCQSPGQVGAQPENPNIYFVCVRSAQGNAVVPWLYKCPSNQVFVTNKCELGL